MLIKKKKNNDNNSLDGKWGLTNCQWWDLGLFIWECQSFRLSLPLIPVAMRWDVLMTKALNDTCGGVYRQWRTHLLDGQMLVSACMPEQATRSCTECHTKDPLNALTEQFGRTPSPHFETFQVACAPWNAWKLLLTTETDVLSLLAPKRPPNWFQGKWFPQTWLPAVIGLYVTHPFPHAC